MKGLPDGWRIATLNEVCARPRKLDPVETGRAAVRYVDIGGIDASQHVITNAGRVGTSSAPSRCRQLLERGDTLFSTVRPYLEKVAFVDRSLHGEFASTGFAVLRPREGLDARFLFHFATSAALLNQVLPMQRGVSYPAVLERDVRSCAIPIPDLGTQRRIVDILEDHLSRLDAAVAATQTTVRRIRTLRAGVLTSEICGPLSSLGDLARDAGYGTSTKCLVGGSGDPVARIPNLAAGRIDMSDEKRAADPSLDLSGLYLREGDLLVVRTNGSKDLIGRTAVVQADMAVAYASYLIRYQLDRERVVPAWAHLALESPRVRHDLESLAASSAGQYNLGLKKLSSVQLPCPDVGTQLAVLARVDSYLEGGHRLGTAATASAAKATSVRRALLAAAFSGRLTASGTPTGTEEMMQ